MNITIYFVSFFVIVCYAMLDVIAKKLIPSIPSYAFICISMIFLAAFSGIASMLYEKDFLISKITPTTWAGIALYGCVNFVGFAVYLYVIANMPVLHFRMIYLATPIVLGGLAYVFLGETFKLQYLPGLGLIGAGLYVALKDWT